VAAVAGLSKAAVSMALRGDPSIPESTRLRVSRTAEEMGYRKDPQLDKLMGYLRGRKRVKVQAVLAVLSLYEAERGLEVRSFSMKRALPAMAHRAERYGYRLAEFSLLEEGMTPRRLRDILVARGIEGVILPGAPTWRARLEFDFDPFSVVALGYSISGDFHRVCQHQYAEMFAILRRLEALGYRRPGLALHPDTDERTLHHYSSAFLWSQERRPPEARVPILLRNDLGERAFGAWFRAHRPDIVLAQRPPATEYLAWLRSLGEDVPATTGFASLDLDDSLVPPVSGMRQDNEGVAAAAVDLVVAQILRAERGRPRRPRVVMIEGSWVDGATTLDRGAARSADEEKMTRDADETPLRGGGGAG
jgi:DNA-binding LacI/PurR family transcriptional regulator